MNGWKIIRIPTVLELTDECFGLYSSMRNVLYAVNNIAGNNSSVEIVFFHERQGEVSIYLFSHFRGRVTIGTLSHSTLRQLHTSSRNWILFPAK